MRCSNVKRSMLLAGVVLLSALVATSQDWRQEWKLKRSGSADKVHFTIERTRTGGRWSHSSDVPLDRFRGLSLDRLERSGPAKFEYVHDAGRIFCEGNFSWGRGSGTFTFMPDAAFAQELKRLGYEPPDDEQLFSMLMANVTLEFARGVKEAGLDASTRQLVELRIHGVRTDFLRDLKSFGYNLPPREVIELRIHGVTSEFLRDLKQAGYDLSAKQITELRIHGVHPEFIRDTKDMGYNFTPKELVELRIHGVNGPYLKKLRDSGMRNLNASQIVKLRIHGID